MISATSLLLIALLICEILCNDNILSKLHQNSYKIKEFRAELLSYNEKYYDYFDLRTFKYNRTTAAVNTTFSVKTTVEDKLEVVVQVYKFLSNEYRRFPIRCQLNVKKCYESNAVGIRAMTSCGNVTNVYFEKDVTYHICNFVLDDTHFPPLIPSGRFRANLSVMYLNEEICLIYAYGEIYTPNEYPPK